MNDLNENQYYNNRVVMNLMFDSFFYKRIIKWSQGENLNEFYC